MHSHIHKHNHKHTNNHTYTHHTRTHAHVQALWRDYTAHCPPTPCHLSAAVTLLENMLSDDVLRSHWRWWSHPTQHPAAVASLHAVWYRYVPRHLWRQPSDRILTDRTVTPSLHSPGVKRVLGGEGGGVCKLCDCVCVELQAMRTHEHFHTQTHS
jgi:hypothetical protein